MELKKHLHIVFCHDHYNPLGVVRSLGEYGISPVVILHSNEKPYLVNKSRYIGNLHVVNTIEEGYQLLLSNYSNEVRPPFIYTCSDDIESYLDLHYNELHDHFFFFDGGRDGQITQVMEKNEMCRLAIECGLQIPKTEEVMVGDLPKSLRYPILTKSVISTFANWKCNVHLCHNENDLIEAYRNIKGERIILQEYIQKKNELCLDGVSVNGGEEIYLPIQSEYIRFSATSYGNYIYFQRYKEFELLPKIHQLIKKTRFSGVFSMEFLRDFDDNFYFLEINFRNSTWSYAHTAVGVNLPVIWAKSVLASHLEILDVKLEKDQFTSMVGYDDFRYNVRHGNVGLLTWIKQLLSCDCYFYWNSKDIKPFVSDLWHRIKKLL